MSLLDILIIVTLLPTCVVYLFYPIVLYILSSMSGPTKRNRGKSLPPRISIVVPTYNEAAVIESKLDSLLRIKYPKNLMEIIVVDSASEDNTSELTEKYTDKGVRLLQQERRLGKANALNFALKETTGEIIVITDANAKFDSEAIFRIIEQFEDDTGALLPQWVPSGRTKLWDRIFSRIHHLQHQLESKVDSVFFVFGELFAFRKKLVSRIDERVAADDLEIAFQIRRQQYRIKYVPNVQAREAVPTTTEEVREQKVRRIFGILQVMKKNRHMLLNRKYGAYGLFIFPTHFVRLTLQPFFILTLLSLLTLKLSNWIIATQLFAVPIVTFSFLFALYFLSPKVRQYFSVLSDFLKLQFYMIIAMVDLVRGKSYHVWRKISSTRTQTIPKPKEAERHDKVS